MSKATAQPLIGWSPIRLQKRLQVFGIPRSWRDRIVTTAKKVAAPQELQWRQTNATLIPAPAGLDPAEFRELGTYSFPAGTIPRTEEAVSALQKIFEDSSARDDGYDGRKSGFLRTIASNGDLLKTHAVREFVLSDAVIAATAHYLAEVPVLSGVHLWWSPPNDTCDESQIYHYDGEDHTQLKLFLNVSEVSEDCGPFTYIDARNSTRIAATKRHSARLDDELVEGTVGAEAVNRLIGPKGTAAAVDTSRCMHYGSRGNSRDRVLLMMQFTRFLAPKAEIPNWSALLPGEVIEELDQVRCRVLNIACPTPV